MNASESVNRSDMRRSMMCAMLLGIGMMAALDEIIFHQILGWHHFFDWSTPMFGLFSDGLLHSAELILFVLGFFMFADLRKRNAFKQTSGWAGFFFGMGGFQLFDGIIDHKLLGLHQIRYVDNILPYDLAWNGFGVLLLLTGFVFARRARVQNRASGSRAGR